LKKLIELEEKQHKNDQESGNIALNNEMELPQPIMKKLLVNEGTNAENDFVIGDE
jgi:hypothetical protein